MAAPILDVPKLRIVNMVDALYVFSELVIPAALGVASVGVAVAAWRTSRSAIRLATQSEVSRREDLERIERREDSATQRAEAQAQAQLLMEWVHEMSSGGSFRSIVTRRFDEPAPPETSLQSLTRVTKATFAVSRVPAASAIYAQTAHDLEFETKRPPADHVRRIYTVAWNTRIEGRIRHWVEFPDASLVALREEWRFAHTNPVEYGQIPLGSGYEDAYFTAQ